MLGLKWHTLGNALGCKVFSPFLHRFKIRQQIILLPVSSSFPLFSGGSEVLLQVIGQVFSFLVELFFFFV